MNQKLCFEGEEYQEKLKLDEQKRAAEEKYKYKRRQIRELQEDIQVLLHQTNHDWGQEFYWTT